MATPTIPTAQVTELAGITGEQLRYWKGVLRPIARRDGRKGGYLFTEAVAIAAIGNAMAQFKLDISRFEAAAADFFEAVATILRDGSVTGAIYLSGDTVTVDAPADEADEVLLIFRIDRIAERLRAALTAAPPASQLSLI